MSFKVKPVGGAFALPSFNEDGSGGLPEGQGFLSSSQVRLANARSALCVLAQVLQPRTAWLPSYLCEAVVQAFATAGVPHEFYKVRGDLGIGVRDWLPRVVKGDLVVVIDYFGFRADPELMRGIKSRGGWVVEDASQALLTDEVGDGADFVVYSPRKFVGVPDGGILVINAPVDFGRVVLKPPGAKWWLESFAARLLRRDLDLFGSRSSWFELCQQTEATAPCGAVRMSDFSEAALGYGFDYAEIAPRRRANYISLSARLGELALFPSLPAGTVPLGFPIRVANRDQVKQVLFAEQIYPPVHWPLDGVVPSGFQESHTLSQELLTLVCDQRYDASDMERTASIVAECAAPVSELAC